MSYVLTLVAADPGSAPLDPALVARVRALINGGAPFELSPGEAVDLPCAAAPEVGRVAAELDDGRVDAIATRAAGRRKRLLIADMDSTIVASETLDELAAFAGVGEAVAAITLRSMNGEVDFVEALRLRVRMLRGLELSALEATWNKTRLTNGARELVATMRANGAVTALVSGGFTFFTRRVAALAGFHVHRANVLADDGSVLTGELLGSVLDRDAKLATLRELAQTHGLTLEETLAVGDGANDLGMLAAAGLGVAFRAKPVVEAATRARVRHGNLRAVLFAQGYSARDIAMASRA